jgi:hypothetical protein
MDDKDISALVGLGAATTPRASARGIARCMRTLADEARSLDLVDTMNALLAAADVCDSESAMQIATNLCATLH